MTAVWKPATASHWPFKPSGPSLSAKGSSELAKTVAQFVQQHLMSGHEKDRLVLVTTLEASGAIRETSEEPSRDCTTHR